MQTLVSHAEANRIQSSIELGTCPECGSKLTIEKKQGFIGKILDSWYQKSFCPVDNKHYSESGIHFDGSKQDW